MHLSLIRWFAALLVVLVVATSCVSDPADEEEESADTEEVETTATILVNARIYTMDPSQPWADAFAYNDEGVIIAVGEEATVRATVQNARIVNAGGVMILPGFQDAHVHVPEAGINAGLCFFEEGLTLADYEVMVAECAETQADFTWVRAAGPALFDLRSTEENPIDVLDRVIPDRPVLILDNLGHAVWTNSLGLELAGITADAPDPQGGVFHRAPDGRLTGLLLEDAQHLVRNAAATDDSTNDRALAASMKLLSSNGITAVSDAGGYWAQGHADAWQRALLEGNMTVRAANSLYVYPGLDLDQQLLEFENRFSDRSDMLRFDTAKVYVDGILDLGTASLIDPYNVAIDPKYPNGFNYFLPEDLTRYVAELHRIGYRINFHVIGDKAVRDALNAVEAIQDTPALISGRRHRTTHNYMVHPDDVARFAALGVIADIQQSADAIDTDYHEFLADFIGDRAFDLIPAAQLLDAGATVTLSSDWDAGPLPPLGTIERSLTRDENAVPDLETALAMVTIDTAYALGHDDTTGSIEVGKFADYVIIDQDLFEIDVTEIDETRVLLTVLNGKPVYAAPSL